MMDKQYLQSFKSYVEAKRYHSPMDAALPCLDWAVAFIQSTPSRDEVLWLVWSNERNGWWQENSAGYTSNLDEAGCYTYAEAFSICRHGGNPRAGSEGRWPYEVMVPAPDGAIKSTSTFTRADGTTSLVRVGEDDRRKSAEGSGNKHGSTVDERWRRQDKKTMFGRRAGDRERWTGEKWITPTPTALSESVYRKIATTQPEQPSLVEPYRSIREDIEKARHLMTRDQQDDLAVVLNLLVGIIDNRLRELDARLGSKQP